MWKSHLFWRLFLTYGALILCSIGVLGAVVLSRLESHMIGQIEEDLRGKAILVEETARGRGGEIRAQFQERLADLRAKMAVRFTLLAEDGTVLADSEEDPRNMEKHHERPEVVAAREGKFGSAQRFSATVQQPMMYLAMRAEPGSEPLAFVRVALPLTTVQQQLSWLRKVVWTVAGITALAAMALAFWIAHRNVRPVQELTEGVERLTQGGFGHKIYVSGRDEVGQLAQTFNQMSSRLAEQFAKLDEDRQQLRAVLSGMVEGVIALDAEQRILFVNERASKLLEFDIQAAVGRKLWEVVRHRPIQELVRKAMGGTEPCSQELTATGPEARHLAVHAAPLAGAASRGVVVVFHDNTELRRLERLRRDFVANVSHELKTPLTVIKACVETLLDGAAEDPHDRTTFLQQVSEQAERLHSLILDLLSLARIESGTEIFEFQSVPLAPVVAAGIERHRARAEAKQQILEGLPMAANSQPTDELAAWADEEAINEILDNLVDNAVKYTPEGGRIWVRWHGEDGQVVLEVEDTGIGIPEQDLPRIFERFYRVDKARSREMGGTGLGLSIVKHLIQAMHGTIKASSKIGQGTTFKVSLPRPSHR